jgi:transcriptional regulator with XRE-family HTH domain
MPRGHPDPALGPLLRAAREDRGLRREQVAADAGITLSTLGNVERGEADPSWSTVRAIAAALELPLAELGRRVEGARREA